MAKRCGDKTTFRYRVTSELVGKYVTILICRKKKFDFAGVFTEKITKEETKTIKWPDQEKDDGTFYGGRKRDFKGLDKLSYKEKFEHQEFEVDLYQGKHKKRSASAPLKIEAYPEKGPEQKIVGIPMPVQMWEELPVYEPTTGNFLFSIYNSTYDDPTGRAYEDPDMNCGKFTREFKDGVVIITVKIALNSTVAGKSTEKAFNLIKKRVEEFWNSEASGFNQWIYHRKECAREEKCNCSVIRNAKREYINAGCCKIPFQIKIEKGSDSDRNTNLINIHFLSPSQIDEATRNRLGLNEWGPDVWSSDLGPNTKLLWYPENRVHTYAHEVGHMMGFPDQYATGVVATGSMNALGPVSGAAWPIDESSIMGGGQTTAKKIHMSAQWFNDWVNTIDAMEVIDKI